MKVAAFDGQHVSCLFHSSHCSGRTKPRIESRCPDAGSFSLRFAADRRLQLCKKSAMRFLTE